MQIAGEPHPLLLDRTPGQFLAGLPQLPYRLGEGHDRGRHHRGDPRGVRGVESAPAVAVDGDRAGDHGHHRPDPPQVRQPHDRARREAEQGEEQQPVAAVRQCQTAGDQAQQHQGHPSGDRVPGLLVEGAEGDVDVERVEREQPQAADPWVGGLALEEVGEGAHPQQQPRQQTEAAAQARVRGDLARLLRGLVLGVEALLVRLVVPLVLPGLADPFADLVHAARELVPCCHTDDATDC